MRTWLILDVNYLGWRAAYSTGELSYRGVGTGVIYGVLREVIALRELYDTERIAFCFDHQRKYLKRLELYPSYKSNRDKHKRDVELYKEVNRQLRHLQSNVLPGLGFRNVFCEKGYEADDIIAKIVEGLSRREEAVIVARDADYYQLLGPRCIIWNPSKGKAITATSFERDYGISPSQWADVKAMAGCHSDTVKGICGVGEKTAIAYLNGTIDKSGAKFKLITKNNKVWRRNLPLVQLPFKGTPEVKLRRDRLKTNKWKRMCRRLGFRSIMGGTSGEAKTKTTKRKRTSQGFGL